MPPKGKKETPAQIEMSEFEDEIDVLDPSGDDPFGLGGGPKFSLEDEGEEDGGNEIVIVDEDDDGLEAEASEEEDEEEYEGEEEGEYQAQPQQPVDVRQTAEYQELARQNRLSQYQGMAAAIALAKKDAEESRRQLITAKEDGDSEKEVEAQERMFRATSIIQQATPHLEQMRRELEGAPAQQQQYQERQPKLTGPAQQWSQNQDFFQKNDDASMAIRAMAVSIDNALAIERTDIGSKEYMDELTRRINASAGKPVAKFTSGRKQATGKRVRNNGTSKVAGGASGGAVKKKAGAVASYSSDEIRELQKFGIDPRNPKHRNIMQRERELRQKREAKGDMIDV